uniref:Nucleotide-diphospho-sugar transferase n=1 Tax=Phytophthora ramorum TaxID=164328 RepID=H3GDI7_PHYRM
MDQASSETHKAPSPETPPMKFSFRTEVRVPLLFLVTVGCILATSIYVNTRLASSAVIGRSNSLGASGYNNAQLDWKMDTAAFENTAAMPAHPTSPYYRRPNTFDRSVSRERGVMVCIHDAMLNMGLSLLRELRCLGNHELIQVYHCGEQELSAQSVELLFSLDNRLELVDVCSDLSSRGVISADMASKFRSWWIKPLAMYHTDVRHVMLLDVDDVVMKNPAVLRELEGYSTTGTTFFYDRVITGMKFLTGNDTGKIYVHKLLHGFDYARFNVSKAFAPSQHMFSTFAFKGKSIHEMDSSMVLIDKQRAGKTVMDIMFWFITEERFRFTYSWGDKETFWLAFELAHVPYFFSPWGVSVVSSMPNEDLKSHPDTLCGSILQYLPVKDSGNETAEVLYTNGKALIDPYPQGIRFIRKAKQNNLFNTVPTHMTPRQQRRAVDMTAHQGEKFNTECLVGMGATPLPDYFSQNLLRRRLHFLGIAMGVLGSVQNCETYE